MSDDLHQAAKLLAEASSSMAFTGAGISVDSGIPDFRSDDGLWTKFNPMEYATIDAFLADPEKVWTMIFEMSTLLTSAKPNPGHVGLATLEQAGRLSGVVTQNIDNLHQMGGSRVVVEYHGNARRLVGMRSGKVYDADAPSVIAAFEHRTPPRCEVSGEILKPDFVFFGEAIPAAAAMASMHMASTCDAMLIIGTSAEVYPAAQLPEVARSAGAALIEINRETTRLTPYVDISLRGRAAEIVPALVALVSERQRRSAN